MIVEWSVFAVADRNAIFDYIEADSPRAAAEIDDRIEAEVERLTQLPGMGRPGRIEGTRELIIGRTPYIAVYRILDNTLYVLRILHGAQLWPEEMPDR